MLEVAVILGALVNVLGTIVYVRDTLRGKTKPNRITFFLWSLAPFIGVVAAVVQGVTWAALPVLAAGLCPFMAFVASFFNKQAIWKLGPFDWACGALSLMALILWQMTKEPNVALLFAILSDGAAALPTIKKCWTHPETETFISYVAGAFSAAMGVVIAKGAVFSEMAFPAYLTLMCLTCAVFIFVRRRRQDVPFSRRDRLKTGKRAFFQPLKASNESNFTKH